MSTGLAGALEASASGRLRSGGTTIAIGGFALDSLVAVSTGAGGTAGAGVGGRGGGTGAISSCETLGDNVAVGIALLVMTGAETAAGNSSGFMRDGPLGGAGSIVGAGDWTGANWTRKSFAPRRLSSQGRFKPSPNC
jgi:hypothetical protein